jgi:hypothetical protein
MGLSANVGRTETDFQWQLRIVNGLLARWRHLAAGACSNARERARQNKKAGARPAFRDATTFGNAAQYLATTGPPKV